jgi:hypothetical protein
MARGPCVRCGKPATTAAHTMKDGEGERAVSVLVSTISSDSFF